MSSDFANLVRVVESDPTAFSYMVNQDNSILARTGIHGETLLHWLAVEGRLLAVRQLAELGAQVDTINEFGNTPLMECALLGNDSMVSLLLDLGASPNKQSERDRNTALHAASENGHSEVVNLLLSRGADPLLKNDYGETAQDLHKFNRKWVKPVHPFGQPTDKNDNLG
jgi:ankyrin repeat protein